MAQRYYTNSANASKTAVPHYPYDPYYPTQNTVTRVRRDNYPVSVGNWIWTFILTAIPVVNFIMFCVWGFSKTTNPSKKNYGLAWFIIYCIILVLAAIAFVVMVFVFNMTLDSFLAYFQA